MKIATHLVNGDERFNGVRLISLDQEQFGVFVEMSAQ